jgi:hypothetical protein
MCGTKPVKSGHQCASVTQLAQVSSYGAMRPGINPRGLVAPLALTALTLRACGHQVGRLGRMLGLRGRTTLNASRRPTRRLVARTDTTSQHRHPLLRPGAQGVAVIIVSEPSAQVARRVRTERSAPVRSRSSAAHNDTPRYADARPISVHPEVLAGVSVPSGVPGIAWLKNSMQRPE